MKIKIDENLPESVATILIGFGHDADTIRGEGISGGTDAQIWEAAQHARRFLITQDLDFSDARKYVPGTHCGPLLIRLASPSRASLVRRVSEIFGNEAVEEWQGCFVVATELKIRVRRPVQ
jgi:predicted nuclease of predicted toxin-antitoxin system